MKTIKYYIIAPIHGLIDELLRQPVVLFTGFLLIFNFGIYTIILFLLSVIFAIILELIVAYRHDRNSIIECIQYFEKFKGCKFKEIPINEIIEKYDNIPEVTQILRPREKIAKLGYGFYVNYDEPVTGARPSTFTSFPSRYLDSFIVFPENPLVLNSLQKFSFFHELGHLSYGHMRAKTIFTQAIVKAVILLLLISIYLKSYPYIIAFAFIGVFNWLYNCWALDMFFDKIKVGERIANGFAISRLYDKPDFEQIENSFKKDKKNESYWNESFDFFKSWSKDPIDVENSKIIKGIFSKSFISNHLSNKIINFSSAIEPYFTPKVIPQFVLLMSIVISAYFSVNVMLPDLLTIAIILIPFPILYFFRVLIYSRLMKIKLADLLNKQDDNSPKIQ